MVRQSKQEQLLRTASDCSFERCDAVYNNEIFNRISMQFTAPIFIVFYPEYGHSMFFRTVNKSVSYYMALSLKTQYFLLPCCSCFFPSLFPTSFPTFFFHLRTPWQSICINYTIHLRKICVINVAAVNSNSYVVTVPK
jgi:hypothetical protein